MANLWHFVKELWNFPLALSCFFPPVFSERLWGQQASTHQTAVCRSGNSRMPRWHPIGFADSLSAPGAIWALLYMSRWCQHPRCSRGSFVFIAARGKSPFTRFWHKLFCTCNNSNGKSVCELATFHLYWMCLYVLGYVLNWATCLPFL